MLPENKQNKSLIDLIDDAMVTGHAKFISKLEKKGIDREFVVKPLYALSAAGFMIPGIAVHKALLVLGLFPCGRMFYTIPSPDKKGNLAMYCMGLVSLVGGEIMMYQSLQQGYSPIVKFGIATIGMGAGAIGLATADYFRKT